MTTTHRTDAHRRGWAVLILALLLAAALSFVLVKGQDPERRARTDLPGMPTADTRGGPTGPPLGSDARRESANPQKSSRPAPEQAEPSAGATRERPRDGRAPGAAPSNVPSTADLPAHVAASVVSGTLRSVGSDTLNNLMALWAEEFTKLHPQVRPAIEGRAGGAGMPQHPMPKSTGFAPMARQWKDTEIAAFVKEFGYEPTAVQVGLDALVLIVHKDNPLAALTLPQVDAVFSKTRKLGAPADLRTWGDLGLTGEWAKQSINLYGRNGAAGTYGYFREHALGKGEFKGTVKEQPGTSSVVGAVASDRFGIGYGAVGYVTSDVRAVPLALTADSRPVVAEVATARDGTYPLARALYLYLNKQPDAPLDPLRSEFLRFVLSRQGQALVQKDGYIPLAGSGAREALRALGIPE